MLAVSDFVFSARSRYPDTAVIEKRLFLRYRPNGEGVLRAVSKVVLRELVEVTCCSERGERSFQEAFPGYVRVGRSSRGNGRELMYVLTYNHGTGRGCVTIHPTENEHAVALREHAILV